MARRLRVRRNAPGIEGFEKATKAKFVVGSLVRRLKETFILPVVYYVMAVSESEVDADTTEYVYSLKSHITGTIVHAVSESALEEITLEYMDMAHAVYANITHTLEETHTLVEDRLLRKGLDKSFIEHSYEEDDGDTEEEEEYAEEDDSDT